jgi:hypothetical protein
VAKRRIPQTDSSELDLRARHREEPLPPGTKRFDVFLIDTRWNAPVSRAVHEHVPQIHQLHPQDSLYILDRHQATEVLRLVPELIGKDPLILVYDLYSTSETQACRYRGFRLCLGLFRNGEQALFKLQEFLRFIAQHRTSRHLDFEVRRLLHREGLDGMIKILTETTAEFLG